MQPRNSRLISSLTASRLRLGLVVSSCLALSLSACGKGGEDPAAVEVVPAGEMSDVAAQGGASGAETAMGGAAGDADPSTDSANAGAEGDPDPELGNVPGVVVVEDDVASCVPLCSDGTAAQDGDWAYEGGHSCVVTGTVTGGNQVCTTGETLPEAVPEAGVVVVNNDDDTIKCIPFCVINIDAAEDPEGDDWSWENNQSCIIPGTLTGANQTCTTLEPVPDPEPRPGIILASEGELECAPVCQIVTEATDDSDADWAYENNESCVLPASASAEGRRECTFTQFPPEYIPAALTGTKVQDGFYVENGRLFDAYGNDFVMRGINNAHIWYDGFGDYKAWHALDNIAEYGTNTVRVVWDTSGDPVILADILLQVVELGMVPMIELHDVTGYVLVPDLIEMVEYYTQPDVLKILQDFREYLLINIANEWSGKGEDFIDTYKIVIGTLRDAGLEHNLVIDANAYGQGWRSLTDYAALLLEADPQHNILFSVHMYDLFKTPEPVTEALTALVAAEIPIIVGEFGHELKGSDVAWEQILADSVALDIGYLAWSWTGNDAETEHLDMAEDWEGPLTQWGEDIFNGPNGIVETAQPASIFAQ